MGNSVLSMSMSLDGFISGPDDGPDNGLGVGGSRLHEWLGPASSQPPHFNPSGLSGQVFSEVMATGAAGDRDVLVHGADLAQSLLAQDLLDELEIHLVPVVLGGGRRLFGTDRVEFELTRVLDAPGVTHLHYRVSPRV